MADEATLTEAQGEQESENIEEEIKEPAQEESVAEAAPDAAPAPAPAPTPAPAAAPRRPYRGGPPGRGRGPRQEDHPGRGRFRPRRKVCSFCVDKVTHIDYKQVDTLRRFVDGHGKIIPRRKTGTCAKHQRGLALAIKYARHLALLPFAAGRSPYN
jgi:small subunit ribosomal protein S18